MSNNSLGRVRSQKAHLTETRMWAIHGLGQARSTAGALAIWIIPKTLTPSETMPWNQCWNSLFSAVHSLFVSKGGRVQEKNKAAQATRHKRSGCAKINRNPPVSFHCINLDDGDWLNWLILTPRNQAILSQITLLLYIHTPNTYMTDWVSAHLAFLRGRVFTIPKKLPTENCQANRFTKNSFECRCCRLFAERNYSTPKQ